MLGMKVVEHVAEACQLSTSTVINIQHQAKCGGIFKFPSDKSRTRINVDDSDRQAIRRVAHGFYECHEYPTLQSVLPNPSSYLLGTLHQILREMGFRYRKQRYIYEQPHIIQQQHAYILAMRSNRASEHPRPTIFLDETWCNSRHCRTHMWVDINGRGGFKHAVGKGPRLIIVHAGGEAGWTSKTDLIFRAKSKTGDYHHEMNSERFLEWSENQLCTLISAGLLIVLDNASYHNTQTEKIQRVIESDMQSWLSNHGIAYDDSDLKADLIAKITDAKPTKKFETWLLRSLHTELVAHPELNPIELAWSVVKRYVAQHNKSSLSMKSRNSFHRASIR